MDIGPDTTRAPQAAAPDAYEHAFVLYLDLLGFSKLLEGDPHDPATALATLRVLEEVAKPDVATKSLWHPKFFMFSDTAIYVQPSSSPPTEPDGEGFLWQVCDHAKRVQRDLLKTGLFVQGGLAYGNVFTDEAKNTVTGPALVEAYELARDEAYVARIAVKEAIIPDSWKQVFDETPTIVAAFGDGVWFIDYLSITPPITLDPPGAEWTAQLDVLTAHQDAVLRMARKATKPAEVARLTWVTWYHNMVIRLLQSRLGEPPKGPAATSYCELQRLLIAELELLEKLHPGLRQANNPVGRSSGSSPC